MDFIREKVAADVKAGKHAGRVLTRFPPEPNGYLHIGHVRAASVDFEVADELGGETNLRFDDTNPEAEDVKFVEAIKNDLSWLGFQWERELYASDYFEKLYELAQQLIREGKAYVDSLKEEELREYRGDYHRPGRESPFRGRSIEENLDLFARMRAGEFPDGEHVLRAKIDLASSNMNMRDPLLYRIRHTSHYRQGDKWCIYPMYDYAHAVSDALEGITHSLCSIEFENHRPLYDWFVKNVPTGGSPEQTEFGRANITYTVLSKRRLKELVRMGVVAGWDDPRMPTIAGLRRRGYTPASLLEFHKQIGLTKSDGFADVALLEHIIREELNKTVPRMMAVLDPIKLVITNYPEGRTEELEAPNSPEDPGLGTRKLTFGRELWIEREDYRDESNKKWFRLAPGKEVRLRYAYIVKCESVIHDDAGNVVEVHCTYDADSQGGAPKDGRKVKGTIHWVSTTTAKDAEVRLYDRLFSVEEPDAGGGEDYKNHVNPSSLSVVTGKIEPHLASVEPGYRCQFERLGYFCADLEEYSAAKPVFNRTISLRDTWAKIEKADG